MRLLWRLRKRPPSSRTTLAYVAVCAYLFGGAFAINELQATVAVAQVFVLVGLAAFIYVSLRV